MQAQVEASIIAGSVAAVGWLVSYILTSVLNRASARRAAALVHIEKQLGELYGPLSFLVLEGEQTFRELLRMLGRHYVFDARDEISPEDLKLWLFWAENDLLPRNEKIKALLSQKTHLLYDSKMLKSYLDFLDHHNSWSILHLRWQKEGIQYSWHSSTNWPPQFKKDVLKAFSELQDTHARLLRRQHTALWRYKQR